jgi:hypothetical protein
MSEPRKNLGNFFSLLRLRLQHLAGRGIEPNLHKRARGRYTLLKALPQNSAGAEVGVWKGDFSQLLTEVVKPRALYLIDPWLIPSNNRQVLQRDKVGFSLNIRGAPVSHQNDLDEIHQHVKNRFQRTPTVQVIRSKSEDAVEHIKNASLDWVYIDGSHYYEDVKKDLQLWTPKLRTGGILCGDDYYWRDPNGEYSVRRAVSEYIDKNSISNWRVYRSQFFMNI